MFVIFLVAWLVKKCIQIRIPDMILIKYEFEWRKAVKRTFSINKNRKG